MDAKALQDDLQSLCFTPSLAKPEVGKEVGRQRAHSFCTNQQRPQCGGVIPDPVWVGSKWLLVFPRVPVTPGTSLHFLLHCYLNDRRRAAHSFFKIGRLISFSYFSCPSLALLRLLIHMAGQVSAILHLLQMGPSKVLTTFPFQIQSSWQLSLLELPPPCCVPTCNTVTLAFFVYRISENNAID